jgi:hypothetical protein
VQQMTPELLDKSTTYEHADDETEYQGRQGEAGMDWGPGRTQVVQIVRLRSGVRRIPLGLRLHGTE